MPLVFAHRMQTIIYVAKAWYANSTAEHMNWAYFKHGFSTGSVTNCSKVQFLGRVFNPQALCVISTILNINIEVGNLLFVIIMRASFNLKKHLLFAHLHPFLFVGMFVYLFNFLFVHQMTKLFIYFHFILAQFFQRSI